MNQVLLLNLRNAVIRLFLRVASVPFVKDFSEGNSCLNFDTGGSLPYTALRRDSKAVPSYVYNFCSFWGLV